MSKNLITIFYVYIKGGFELELAHFIIQTVNISVIASGGTRKEAHFVEVFEKADAVLAASIFDFKKYKLTI